jgi:hypothetical protein
VFEEFFTGPDFEVRICAFLRYESWLEKELYDLEIPQFISKMEIKNVTESSDWSSLRIAQKND